MDGEISNIRFSRGGHMLLEEVPQNVLKCLPPLPSEETLE